MNRTLIVKFRKPDIISDIFEQSYLYSPLQLLEFVLLDHFLNPEDCFHCHLLILRLIQLLLLHQAEDQYLQSNGRHPTSLGLKYFMCKSKN